MAYHFRVYDYDGIYHYVIYRYAKNSFPSIQLRLIAVEAR